MKLVLERYFFPAVVILTIVGVLTAMEIIHKKRSELSIVRNLDHDITTKKVELAGLNEKITVLKQEEAVFLQKRASTVESMKESEDALSALSKEKAEAEGKIARAAIAVQEEQIASKNLNELTIQINQSKAQELQLKQAVHQKQVEIKKTEEELSTLKNEVGALQKQKVQLSAMELEFERVKQNLQFATTQYNAIKENEKTSRAVILEAKAAYKKNQGEIDLVSAKLVDLESKQQQLAALKEQIQVLSDRQKSQQDELTILNQQKVDLQSAAAEYQRIKTLTAGLEKDRKDLNGSIAALKGEKAVLTGECAKRQEQLASLIQKNTLLQKEQARYLQAQAQMQSIQNEMTVLQGTLTAQKKIFGELQNKTAEKKAELEVMEQKLNEIRAKIQENILRGDK